MFEEERPQKRRRTDDDHRSRPSITHSDHIWKLLEFQQSVELHVRDNVNAFRDFLGSIAQDEDVAKQSKQLRILKQYCDQQTANSKDGLALYDVIQTWSFASENNGEAIASAVPAALAQLLKMISSFLEFREFGLLLIDTLLRKDQLKLFEKGLHSSKSKSHLISPCLRLLTEMVKFDAGARAQQVWSRREVLLSRFDVLLDQNISTTDAEERKKPTLRRMSLRLFLALLRYLDRSSKNEMLTQARMLHACLRSMLNDGDDIVIDILKTLDDHLLEDAGVSRSHLARFFNSLHLENIAALFKYELDNDSENSATTIARAAASFLTKLCSTQKGILQEQDGWYPPGLYNQSSIIIEEDFIDLGVDSPGQFDAYTNNVPVVNIQLSLFLRSLQPTDPIQSDLIVKIFRAAPELVAAYFSHPLQLVVPDSDNSLWRGQIVFLSAVIESPLPVSKDKNVSKPPPSTIVVESILPRCLTRAYLNKLLFSDDEVCRISAARLITVALRKLEKVLLSFKKPDNDQKDLYSQMSTRLAELLEARLPPLKDVTLALQRTSVIDNTARLSLLECVSVFFSILPSVSYTGFDVSPIMSALCNQVVNDHATSNSLEQLKYCVDIASLSSSTKWLSKSDAESLTLAAQVLQVIVNRTMVGIISHLTKSLRQILDTNGILSATTFSALVTSLSSDGKFVADSCTYSFLDNCMVRASQKPVRYLDEIEILQQTVSDKKPLSLLACSAAEQWPFAIKKYEKDKDALKNIAAWIARFHSLLDAAGENFRVMSNLQDKMLNETAGKAKEYLQKAIERSSKKNISLDPLSENETMSGMDDLQTHEKQNSPVIGDEKANIFGQFEYNIGIPDSVSGLTKWSEATDFDLEVQTNRVSRLVFCTASSSDEIRRQTFSILQTITHVLSNMNAPTTSGVPSDSTTQLLLLLGEITQTVSVSDLTQPLPTLVPALAHALLPIIANPTHPMYAKANKFLLHAPSWNIRRLIPYWVDRILLREPGSDQPTATSDEVDWLLTWLCDACRTPLDLDLYRKCGVFERVGSLYASITSTRSSKKLIRQLLHTALTIDGGADTLATRFGAESWLRSMIVLDGENAKELEILEEKMRRAWSEEKMEAWKIGCSRYRSAQVIEVRA